MTRAARPRWTRPPLLAGLLAVIATLSAACSASPAHVTNWSAVSSSPDRGAPGQLVAAARREGTLNVIGLAPARAGYGTVISDFSRKYGIKVRSEDPDATSQQEIAAVRGENGTSAAPDVLDLDMSVALANENLFASYQVSTWSSIPTGQKDPSGLWVQDYGGYMSVGYPARLGTITSLTQLLSPKFKHAVTLESNPAAMPLPGGEVLSSPALGAVTMASLAHGGTPASITRGMTFFRELSKAGNLAPAGGTGPDTGAGTGPVTLNWDYLNRPPGNAAGWKVFIPAGALVASYNAQAINKDAPHPAAARLWEEFLYSQAPDGGQNLWLKAGARPVELAAMTANGTINTAAARRLPPATGTPVFLTPAQATIAAAYLAANWANISH